MSASGAPPEQVDGIVIYNSTSIDLGTPSDPGNNTFINKSLHCEKSPTNLLWGYSIKNNTTNNISAYGNYFEGEYLVNCNPPFDKYGTYEDMLKHPNPNDSASDIKIIYDGHDDPKYGIVDYSGFKKAP